MASTSTESPPAAEAAVASTSLSSAFQSNSSESVASGSGSSSSSHSANTKARLENLIDDSAAAGGAADPSNPSTSAGEGADGAAGGGASDSTYECTICLETAKDAVVSMCGHLFCWPCLHQWLETRPQRQMCPVCKAAISRDKVIPLYGRDNKNQQDPRTKEAPPRPTAQRTEPESNNFHGFGFPDGGGFHMSFGIGAFPFGFFTSSFNFGNEQRQPNASEEEQFLSKLFLWVGILFLAWLILA